MSLKKIESTQAPRPVGPYSQAIAAGGFLFVSGQIALDPATQQLVAGGISEQTQQVFKNIAAILGAAQLRFDNVVKVEIFLADMADYAAVNSWYTRFFTVEPLPARYVVAVASLPKQAQIEVSLTACFYQ